jgi:hypothetical protein
MFGQASVIKMIEDHDVDAFGGCHSLLWAKILLQEHILLRNNDTLAMASVILSPFACNVIFGVV